MANSVSPALSASPPTTTTSNTPISAGSPTASRALSTILPTTESFPACPAATASNGSRLARPNPSARLAANRHPNTVSCRPSDVAAKMRSTPNRRRSANDRDLLAFLDAEQVAVAGFEDEAVPHLRVAAGDRRQQRPPPRLRPRGAMRVLPVRQHRFGGVAGDVAVDELAGVAEQFLEDPGDVGFGAVFEDIGANDPVERPLGQAGERRKIGRAACRERGETSVG